MTTHRPNDGETLNHLSQQHNKRNGLWLRAFLHHARYSTPSIWIAQYVVNRQIRDGGNCEMMSDSPSRGRCTTQRPLPRDHCTAPLRKSNIEYLSGHDHYAHDLISVIECEVHPALHLCGPVPHGERVDEAASHGPQGRR